MFWLIQFRADLSLLSTQSISENLFASGRRSIAPACARIFVRKDVFGCDLRGSGSEVEFNRFLYWVPWVFEVLILIAEKAKKSGKKANVESRDSLLDALKWENSIYPFGWMETWKRDTWEKSSVSGFDAFAIFIISTCVLEELKNGGWKIIGWEWRKIELILLGIVVMERHKKKISLLVENCQWQLTWIIWNLYALRT